MRNQLVVGGLIAVVAMAVPELCAGAPTKTLRSTGDIAWLSPSTITVGKLKCSIGAGSPAAKALSFVVGDRVTILCGGHLLKTISYATPRAAAQRLATQSSKTPTTQASASPASCGGSSTITSPIPPSSAAPNGGSLVTATSGSDACMTGVITAFGPASSDDSCTDINGDGHPAGFENRPCASISVSGFTCRIGALFYRQIHDMYSVGDTVLIGCNAGVLHRIQ